MRIEICFPGEMEAGVSVRDSGRRADKRPDGVLVEPIFYLPTSRTPVLHLLVYGNDDEVIAKYIVTQAGMTGRLRLEDRSNPVQPRYEQAKGEAWSLDNEEEEEDDEP